MGIDTDCNTVRAKTRGKVRGAMSAAAHALLRVVRMVIRESPEQCRATSWKARIPTERSETLLEVKAKALAVKPSSARENKIIRLYDHTITRSEILRRMDLWGVAAEGIRDQRDPNGANCFEIGASQPCIDSNSRPWSTMVDHGRQWSAMVDHGGTER